MLSAEERRQRLEAARVYLVIDAAAAPAVVPEALAGGVDLVQLREKNMTDAEILEAAREVLALCEQHDALFILNDRPDLAGMCGAHGVHVGQDDEPVESVRATVGDEAIVGVSTHSPDQIEAAELSSADYFAVGPVWETPTKAGRPAVGLDLVEHAAARAPGKPWFAIGGIDASRAPEVVDAGARRIVVVRALRDADDPRAAARALRETLEREPVGGQAQ
ncbi:MAG: thiamine-phosphate pyrophosphorylase [Thermoleophilaceae bacterium]|nr:thiamine-phosphate pyrophosphorylase [Thermoleophilaceae bacterium]